MLFRPVKQVVVGWQVLVDSFQVRGYQVTWDVAAADGTFGTIASRAVEAKLGARQINDGQGLFGHGSVRHG
jgi:hypothetical protein